MKITTTNKDYYDFHARNRVISDPTYLWSRKPEYVKTTFSVPIHFSSYYSTSIDSVCGFMIHFCGRLIPVLYFKKDHRYSDPKSGYFYKLEDLPSEVLALNDKNHQFIWKEIVALFGVVNHPWCGKFGNGCVLPRLSLVEMHRKLNTPVFINGAIFNDEEYLKLNDPLCHHKDANPYYSFNYDQILVNPQLHSFEFIKCMDAFSAFIELERFVSNDLAPNSDDKMNVKIPDSIKAESKGFDKWSFRKMKG